MPRDYVMQPFRASVDFQIDYAAELNAQQYAAVTALPGPSLVIAGAGSGKTRTLTYRVAYLIEQGIPPDRILLLTFTNKAAREMMRRVADCGAAPSTPSECESSGVMRICWDSAGISPSWIERIRRI
jgi:DNA helicase-2/ATP-dependent DNA helicase PcrA